MARTIRYKQINIDVEPFLSIMAIVLKLISLILVVIVMRIALNKDGLKIIALRGLYPGKGSLQHLKSPAYLDCYPDKVIIYPGKQVVTWDDLRKPSNTLEKLLTRIEANTAKEYVVILVRPESVALYRAVRKLVQQRSIEIGMEVIDADYDVNWDEAAKATGVN
jgi:hypothetical protein